MNPFRTARVRHAAADDSPTLLGSLFSVGVAGLALWLLVL